MTYFLTDPCAVPLDARSRQLRRVMLDALYTAGRGHLPSAFSCTEILRVLYDSILRYDSAQPFWTLRDRCILSKGHACLALYTLLADKGFFPQAELDNFCAFGAPLGGHPERGLAPGIEASTGSLGHGPSLGVGMALALRMDGSHARVFVLCGDGETNEGSVWEAALSAAKHKLDNFTLIIDYNKQQSWGDVPDILPLEPYVDKFKTFGFAVAEVNGHDVAALQQLLGKLPFVQHKPSVVICHTRKGKGIASLEGDLRWHHKTRLSTEEYTKLAQELGEQHTGEQA